MQGEYRGDFTRDTFDKTKHFLRVLQQQGRVWLEADFNEQAAILLHYLQALAVDLIGPHGGPANNFLIGVDQNTFGLGDQEWNDLTSRLNLQTGDFVIGKGHYYVDGILCENEDYALYSAQHNFPGVDRLKHDTANTYLVYLDVWERHITYIEDDSIREVALGGPDTATRAKVLWQVKTTNKNFDGNGITSGITRHDVESNWNKWKENWQPANRGMLKARVKPEEVSTDPCITSPESRYRGAENQLYRVEIHKSGTVWNGKDDDNGGNARTAATFKWSRENGSVTFPIRSLSGTTATLEHLGRDKHLSLVPGDWVEIVDDDYALRGEPSPLRKVMSVKPDEMSIELNDSVPNQYDEKSTNHPLLRRWDHKAGDPNQGGLQLQDGAALIEEGNDENGWLELEDGIQIQFQPGATYRPGDYWLIPARTATGDVEWRTEAPKDSEGNAVTVPMAKPPDGVEHHYAPLWIITLGSDGTVTAKANNDLRRKITKI